jgi:PAS domain S-box-containing protein
MDAGERALKCLIVSNSQTFLKEITKNLKNYKRGCDIRSSNNPGNIKNLIFFLDLAIVEDDFIHQTGEKVLIDLISFLHASQIKVILLNDFKKKLPDYVARRTDFIRFVSKSASIREFYFVLDEIEYQIRNKIKSTKSSHDKYLEAIIQIQNLLLKKMPLDIKVKEVLKVVGITAAASRVALFENKYDSNGKFLMSFRFEWLNTKHINDQDQPIFRVMPYKPNFSRWAMAMGTGKIINGYVHKFPNSEQPLLKTLGARNLLLLPINFKSQFWGFIFIAVNRQQKLWEKDHLPYLKSIIAPISSYLELKQEENKREHRDANLEHLFKDSDIGYFFANREGKLKSYNKAFGKMIGYNPGMKELNLKSLSFPDDFTREVPMLKKMLSGEISNFQIEKRFVASDGQHVWVKVNLSAYEKREGKPDSFVGLVEDISKQKSVESAFHESEDRYKMLSGLSFEGIVMHKHGKIVDCNQRLLEIFGYERDFLIGKNLNNLLADGSSVNLVKNKIKNDDLRPFDVLGVTKSGDEIPFEIEFGTIEFQGEHIWVTAFRDIRERRENEQKIKKLNTAVNQSPTSIVITDRDGKIEYVNKSFSEISGYSSEDVIGKNPRILKTDHHSKAFYQNLWETILKGETWQGILKNKAKDGRYFWERAAISPIFDEKKNITHYLAIKENITTEKETREALEKSEERHRIIADLTNDFVYSALIHDSKISIKWKSGSLEKLAGYEMHEINDKAIGWYSIIHEDDLENIVFPAIINLPREKIQNIEYRILTKGNKEKWVSDKLRLISDDIERDKMEVIGAIQDITTRKTVNIALDQSKKYLDSIIDNLPIGLQIFDEKGFTTRMNEAQKKLLGLSDLENTKGKFNILTDPPFKVDFPEKEGYKDVYERKITIHREVELDLSRLENQTEHKEDKITINEIVFPILRNDGKVHSVISLTNDITKRVDAEKALKASEMHQKTLLRLIPDLIFVFNDEGLFKDVYTEDNNRLLMPPGDFIDKSFRDVFPESLGDIFYDHLVKAVESREMQSFNYEMDVEDKTFYYETRLLVSKEHEVIAIIRDITDYTIAQYSIKESEEKFRELAERTQDTLILFSASNEILYVSPNLQKVIGITAEDYLKDPRIALKLIYPDDRSKVISKLNKYRKARKDSMDIQFRVLVSEDEIKWLWYRENTIFNDNHEPVRYAAVVTDITPNKQAEEQLKKAKEEAEKAFRSKSVFLANMSHEIRTPMNAVLGFTDLLSSRITDPVLKGYLNSIKSSGNTLLNLLNDILDLSKIEAEKMRMMYSPVNLFSVFEEVKHIFSLKALEKGLDYSFKIDKNLPESLMLDELRLKQILLNLIDNAIKFTEEGGIKVKAKLIGEQDDEDKIDLLITVEDTGIGIPEKMQSSIFESFRQQDDQDKKKYKGTGLGLAITKRLVELFNGTIKLKSKVGRGSKFEIILTDIEVSEPIINTQASSRKLHFDKGSLKGRVIVIIDEQKTNRDLIREVFHKSECKIIEGESVEAILDSLPQKIDMLVLEMKNPGFVLEDLILMNNHSVLKKASKIGVTSTSEFNFEPKILAAFKTILTKPIQLDRFVDLVDADLNIKEHKGKSNGSVYGDNIVDFRILNEVIKLLKGEMHEKWQSAMDTSSFAEIEQFAQSIKEVGTEFNLDALNTFSDVLTMHVKNFDIDRMIEVLNTYPAIIKELKGNLKNLASDN